MPVPEFPSDALITTELISSEQLAKEGWSPAGTRENWVDGPWRDEPDKVIWTDPETGLDCMILRNRMGTLCGYVGIPKEHPWYGIDYSGCLKRHVPLTQEERLAKARKAYDGARAAYDADPTDIPASNLRFAELHLKSMEGGGFMAEYKEYPCLAYDKEDRCSSPESYLRAHGGITYSGASSGYQSYVCREGRPEDVWLYGFDCGHCNDFSPGMEATTRWIDSKHRPNPFRDPNATYDPQTGTKTEHGMDAVYRDMGYVKLEVEDLAKQLAAIRETTDERA